jgi:exodeoxyribonuclease-3
MRIASFNVNSLRARLPIVTAWLKTHQPDILAVQETKVQDKDFPGEPFDALQYHYAFKGQKSYNGVALFSLQPLHDITYGLDNEPKDEPRLISATINDITIVNTYVPQGYERDSDKFAYKLAWFERLRTYFQTHMTPSDPVIWVGDLNVAPEPEDVHDPKGLLGHVCFCPEVTEAFYNITRWGFVDLFRQHCLDPGHYTFWDYRGRNTLANNRGWRVDHILATKPLAAQCTACYIDRDPRCAERPSDHTPIISEFNVP